MADDLDPLEQHLLDELHGLTSGSAASMPTEILESAWRAARDSRLCDHAARWLQAQKLGYYTIGSAGHESNALVALALRPTDPALLHYRSGGFYLARAEQLGRDGVDDILLGIAAAQDEPIAGGRHKVFGHHGLAIIPQTSTIASHLPRAVGVAFAIERTRELGLESTWPHDAVVVCSLGDASLNHATTQAALNTTAWHAYQGTALPILFVCEDNGIGISVRTPESWVTQSLVGRPELAFEEVDGADAATTFSVASELGEWVRANRHPAILRLRTVRYLSHAGADVETAYRTAQEIRAEYALDPLLGVARALVGSGTRTGEALADDYLEARGSVRDRALAATTHGQLTTADEVMAPLAPRRPTAIEIEARTTGGRVAEPVTLAQSINAGLADVLDSHPETLLFGEDIGAKGGVYGVTRGLQTRFGERRVFDTLLDETSILGLALGSAVSGLVPIPEIQYLAYLHNAEDQLRGEAATLRFFSKGAYRNGLVIRIQGLGYQRGFGGHFHNDNAVGVIRDIPGLVIACPSRADDAASMLRTCVAAAKVDGTVSVYLEPIALYHTRDLYIEGDGAWLGVPVDAHIPIGAARTYGAGHDLTIVTFGNGVPMSLRVVARLAEAGIDARVVDLRWLAPLPMADVLREAGASGRVLVADETRRTGGVGEGIVTELVAAGFQGRIARVASKDSFIPLGDAARLVLLSEEEIEDAARALVS